MAEIEFLGISKLENINESIDNYACKVNRKLNVHMKVPKWLTIYGDILVIFNLLMFSTDNAMFSGFEEFFEVGVGLRSVLTLFGCIFIPFVLIAHAADKSRSYHNLQNNINTTKICRMILLGQ